MSRSANRLKPITTDWLKRLNACDDQVETFGSLFGPEAELTRENLTKASNAGLSLDWLAERILTAPAWRAYQKATAPAWRAYQEATPTAEWTYLEVKVTAWRAYQDVTATVLADCLGLLVSDSLVVQEKANA